MFPVISKRMEGQPCFSEKFKNGCPEMEGRMDAKWMPKMAGQKPCPHMGRKMVSPKKAEP